MSDLKLPLVTIVIVNHNYGSYVEQCIRSVDQQDYKNIQCIVLECASKDNSLSIIEAALGRTKGAFFQLVRREINRGHALNALSALDEIQGDFVTFLDADDLLFPEFVTTHVTAHLNESNSAAVSATDQVQIGAAGQVIASTCHWHQKWRRSEPETAWVDLANARSWTPNAPSRLEHTAGPRLAYVPAWWSSWLRERWIWSATSGLMFRSSIIRSLAPPIERMEKLISAMEFDSYFARFAHSAGGTLVIDDALGAYRRHGSNLFSANQVLGGQTTNGSLDSCRRFDNARQVARETLAANYAELVRQLGGELYYSIAWQLMSNSDFLTFVKDHEDDRPIWEKTLTFAGVASP